MHVRTMTSKHHRWQTAWHLEGSTALHSSGLVVEFAPVDMVEHAEQPRQVGHSPPATIDCSSVDGARWRGQVHGGPAALAAWLADQPALRDPSSQSARVSRLLREAAAVFTTARDPTGRRPTLRRDT
jgi:hypothetical protein